MSSNLEIPIGISEIFRGIDAVCKASTRNGVSEDMRTHVLSLMQVTATSVMALSGLPKCQLGTPHAAIQTAYDASGNLRLECLHPITHCWSLSGAKGPC